MKRQSERSYLYGLADPVTGIIRYIGQSLHPKKRLYQHITESHRGYLITSMHRWIEGLLHQRTRPRLIILGIFSPEDITAYEARMVELLNGDGNELFNHHRASGVGYHGEAQNYTIQCVETGEEFPSYAAAGRAYGCTPKRIRLHYEGSKTDGFHFRQVNR